MEAVQQKEIIDPDEAATIRLILRQAEVVAEPLNIQPQHIGGRAVSYFVKQPLLDLG